MKPAWDQLMEEFASSNTAIVADVDCTTESGKVLCEEHGVEGFPTIKWGDPSALEDYEGGRDYEDLSAFAKESLGPLCSPNNLDLCDADMKKQIEDIQAMSKDALDKAIAEKEGVIAEAGTSFEKDIEALQARYEELEKEKTATIKAIKDSGLGLMKSVAAQREASSDEL